MAENASESKAIDVSRAFIDGIRTVIIVDDKMPSYDQMTRRRADQRRAKEQEILSRSGAEEGVAGFHAGEIPPPIPALPEDIPEDAEDEVAGALVRDFRGRGWLHDILNRDFDQHGAMRARNCDLVILDYRLGDEGERSLKILYELAKSPRLHLVVLYTRDQQQHAWFDIAASLSSAPSAPELIEQDDEDLRKFGELNGPDFQAIADVFAGNLRAPALPLDRKAKLASSPLEKQLRQLSAVRHGAEEHRRRDAKRVIAGIKPLSKLEVSRGDLKWIRCENVFIVVKEKQDSQGAGGPVKGDALISDLRAALAEWQPSFFRRMLRYLRHEIARHGLGVDADVLRGSIGEAALLIYAHQGSPEERILHRRRIYLQVFESVLHRILEDDILLHAPEDMESGVTPFSHAAKALQLDEKTQKQQVFVRLNCFLAFEEKHPPYLRTGTVFRVPGHDSDVGICVSPQCDLVPREKKKALQNTESGTDERGSAAEVEKKEEVGPKHKASRPVLWRQAQLLTDTNNEGRKAIGKALCDAEKYDALFLTLSNTDGSTYDSVIQLRTKSPKPKMFFVANDGRIMNDCFEATEVFQTEEGIPEIDPEGKKKYQVIGQLREAYATKLLHESGSELSRVGVDMVKMK